jgi:DNA-binding transcriptional LysR family regulator
VPGVDLDGVRTFVTVADTGQFSEAAVELAVTQQAVSKRVAALERELGVRLLTRGARGAAPTADGHAFLPHARELLRVAARAEAALRPGRRALRVDVLARRSAPAGLVQDFHRTHSEVELDVVTLPDAATALEAVDAGAVDATFRSVPPGHRLPRQLRTTRVLDEPLQLLVGRRHPLADADELRPAALAGHRIWIPGIVAGAEWADYYDDFARTFGPIIDSTGPNFGTEAMLEAIGSSSELATLFGDRSRHLRSDADLRFIPLRDPTPVYPHSLVWRSDNPHPGLGALRRHLGTAAPSRETWTPGAPQ